VKRTETVFTTAAVPAALAAHKPRRAACYDASTASF
jgi:hypothetical protein